MKLVHRKNEHNIKVKPVIRQHDYISLNRFIEFLIRSCIGSGWLTLIIVGATHLGSCDVFDGSCELFVKVGVNHKELCRTDFQRDQNFVDFFKTCITKRIPRTSTIAIELWDKDVSYDDRLANWQTSVNEITNDGMFRSGPSKVMMLAFWKDEYSEAF